MRARTHLPVALRRPSSVLSPNQLSPPLSQPALAPIHPFNDLAYSRTMSSLPSLSVEEERHPGESLSSNELKIRLLGRHLRRQLDRHRQSAASTRPLFVGMQGPQGCGVCLPFVFIGLPSNGWPSWDGRTTLSTRADPTLVPSPPHLSPHLSLSLQARRLCAMACNVTSQRIPTERSVVWSCL